MFGASSSFSGLPSRVALCSTMFITGLGTAVPPRRYAQTECWEAFLQSPQSRRLNSRSRAIIKKVLTGNNGVVSRHLALEHLGQAFEVTPDVLHERYRKHPPLVPSQAAERALADAGCQAAEIEAVLISSCTGYLCPGLTSYVSERLGLRSDALMLDLVGQGCGAALPNLRAAEALLTAGRSRVLSICVEICSAALYFDDDPGVSVWRWRGRRGPGQSTQRPPGCEIQDQRFDAPPERPRPAALRAKGRNAPQHPDATGACSRRPARRKGL